MKSYDHSASIFPVHKVDIGWVHLYSRNKPVGASDLILIPVISRISQSNVVINFFSTSKVCQRVVLEEWETATSPDY